MAGDTVEDPRVRKLLELFGTGRQCTDISVPDMAEASRITHRMRILREARGERSMGRKIGFSNQSIWANYGVDRPIWNYVWNTTLHPVTGADAVVELARFAEPRIEPEIVLHLAQAPQPGMDEDALLGCIDCVSHGFEIVQSVYPGWKFTAPDAAAAFGLHGALVIGPWHDVQENRTDWATQLRNFNVVLRRNGSIVETGHARNVLGGPLTALRYLVDTIAAEPQGVPLQAGELVTTGTLTDAYPIAPGDLWSTEFEGIGVTGLRVCFH